MLLLHVLPYTSIPYNKREWTNAKYSILSTVLLTDILAHTVLELLQLTVQIMDTLCFEPPLGGLGTKYDVHLVIIGKCIVDFLLVLIELLLLGVKAEALGAKTDRKSAISLQRSQFDPKFQVQGIAPTNHFCPVSWANECLTTLSLTVFTQRNFVADFLQAKCNFTRKTTVLRF